MPHGSQRRVSPPQATTGILAFIRKFKKMSPAPARLAEANKKPGLVYAFTNEGVELPFIDVTHPEFEVKLTDEEIAARTATHLDQERHRARTPLLLRKF